MASPALVAALRRSREKWVKLDDDDEGRRVKFLRPPESEIGAMLTTVPGESDATGKPLRVWSVGLEHVNKYVVDWDHFTEATFLGAGIGASDPVAFDPDLWREYVADDISAISKIADAILKSVVDFITERDATEKNSRAGSTLPPPPPAG